MAEGVESPDDNTVVDMHVLMLDEEGEQDDVVVAAEEAYGDVMAAEEAYGDVGVVWESKRLPSREHYLPVY
jgi:hypothetical protein